MANINSKGTITPGFMTYREAAIMFSLMPEMDAAKAIKATVDYYLYGSVRDDLSGSAEQVFAIMRADIDRNNEKYEKTVERNRENVKKRWAKGDTTGIPLVNQSNTNLKPETINSKPETSKTGDNAAAPQRAKRFTPPSLEDVQRYVGERGSRVDPQGFIDFYAAKGWKIGKTPMKDWKAACRNAEHWERWDVKNTERDRLRTFSDYERGESFLD